VWSCTVSIFSTLSVAGLLLSLGCPRGSRKMTPKDINQSALGYFLGKSICLFFVHTHQQAIYWRFSLSYFLFRLVDCCCDSQRSLSISIHSEHHYIISHRLFR
jgi:hypothetical protein